MPRFLREYSLELSSIVFMVGLIMTVFVVIKYFFSASAPYYISNILQAIGNWIVWLTVIGPLLLMGGGWYFFDGVKKRWEFAHLINTESKAVFLRNIDRLEELSYNLTERHRELFYEKKRELKIR
ncbi:MAG: DUF3198 domain-containing protein [Thermoplasmata archaeon]